MARIAAIGGYKPLFQQAFPGEVKPITSGNIGKAIATFERTLLTPAPFDSYLRGSAQAISPIARSGLRRFIDVGCASCHNRVGVGGQMFQKFGVREDYWKATGSTEVDKGRFDFTKDPGDLYLFKVPSLRNVAMTAPYFHDGSVSTLDAEIVAFLGALTGPLPASFATAPTLPPVVRRDQ